MKYFALAALLAAAPAQAQVYKCVDARGVTQYADKPCPDGRGGAVDIRSQPPISGGVSPRGGDMKAEELDFRRRRLEREREEQAQAQAAEAQRQRCAQLKAAHQRFTTASRISVTDAKGESRYLETAERDAGTARLEAEIARTCR